MNIPIHARLTSALAARNAQEVANLYAEDATFITAGRPPSEGSRAVMQMMQVDFDDPGFNLKLSEQRSQIASSEDLAYARGVFRAEFTDPLTGEIKAVTGHYVQVFERGGDGEWKIVEDISTTAGVG